VIVAGVWAVAATAIALIALLDNSDDDAEEKAEANAAKVAKSERDLDARIDKLEGQLEGLPQSEDVSKLEGRLATVERDAKKAAADAKSASGKVTDLEDRVKTLEDAADSDTGDGTDTGADAPP
jgi:chromosome segregation ATPase